MPQSNRLPVIAYAGACIGLALGLLKHALTPGAWQLETWLGLAGGAIAVPAFLWLILAGSNGNVSFPRGPRIDYLYWGMLVGVAFMLASHGVALAGI